MPPTASRHAAERLALIYDADCRLCIAGSARLISLARPGSIERVGSSDPSLASRFPQISPEMIRQAMQLIGSDGRVYSGAAAVAQALSTRPAWRLVTWLYRVPGVRWAADAVYRWVARNRYRIMGRVGACDSGTCDSGACARRT